jgi:hypothetical protein
MITEDAAVGGICGFSFYFMLLYVPGKYDHVYG